MRWQLAATGSVAAAALLVAAACGDVNADLELPNAPSTQVDSGGSSGRNSTVQILTETFPTSCATLPPQAAFFADGGTLEEAVAELDAGIAPHPHLCTAPSACEYARAPRTDGGTGGPSADRQCNRMFACDGELWRETPNVACHEQACPATRTTRGQLEGTPCDLKSDDAGPADEAVCNVSDGVCACTTGRGGTDVHERRWSCSAPLLRACPLERPLIGAACDGERYCDYGACRWKRGFAMACHLGVWQAAPGNCN